MRGMQSLSKGKKKILSLIVMLAMVLSSSAVAFAAGDEGTAAESQETQNAAQITLTEGEYAPGEVIVMFRDGAVDSSKTSLKKARSLDNVSEDFGSLAEATGDEGEEAKTVKSEVSIIKESLGDDFEIDDSLGFDFSSSGSDLKIALVTSKSLDTETMIRLLSENEDIAAVEANTYIRHESYDDFSDYSLTDEYSDYLYQANDPAAKNTSGKSVDLRGGVEGSVISTNAASGWEKLTGEEEEVVVAVVDTGVNPDHEDLVNRLWENDPDTTGLAGEHGYNFANNNTDISDHNGHGTHCAGIIAAEANDIGTAGITGPANVKIMVLNTNGSGSEDDESKLFVAMGAFSYVIKAKQRGVNVVATSNSWGREDSDSQVFNEIIDRMGEEGILTFIAAGNSRQDLDKTTTNPASTESDYAITVGAGGNTGERAGFSNYGKNSVDIFAPGLNILSTVGYNCYFPTIYDDEELAKTTEYYGSFTTDTEVKDNKVTPVTATSSESVKQFGEFVFHKQKDENADISWEIPDTANCKIEVVNDHYFGTKNKASLKVTIEKAQLGEEYYVYFPYEKNSATTGMDNTRFSIEYQDGDVPEEGNSAVECGEIIAAADGSCELTGSGFNGHNLGVMNKNLDTHVFVPAEQGNLNEKIISYDDMPEGSTAGLGLRITPTTESQIVPSWADAENGETHDLVFYIDSLGVSVPDVEINLNQSYEMMSGTSMACPAAAGAGALIAALYPRAEGQSGAEYATMIRNKLFSCARRTEALEDLCYTGGYIDLRLLNADSPAISDAICDTENNTITLTGENFVKDSKKCELFYKRTLLDGATDAQLPCDGMTLTYAEDGTSVVIGNASKLFGTLTQFTAKAGDTEGTAKFFLVKGQKKLEEIATELYKNPDEEKYVDRSFYYLATTADGSDMYAYENDTGQLAKLDGNNIVQIPGTSLIDHMKSVTKAAGANEYEIINDYSFEVPRLKRSLNSGDILYQPCSISHTDPAKDEDEYTTYLASVDLSQDSPKWSMKEWTTADSYYANEVQTDEDAGTPNFVYAAIGQTIYAYGGIEGRDESVLMSYDVEKGSWKQEKGIDANISLPTFTTYKGDLYVLFGFNGGVGAKGSAESKLQNGVWKYDVESKEWSQTGTLSYIGKYDDEWHRPIFDVHCAETKNGLLFVNASVDGAGNVFLYDPEADSTTPLYFTINDGICDRPFSNTSSCVATADGVYYIKDHSDEMRRGYMLYELPLSWGLYESKYASAEPEPEPETKTVPALSMTSAKLAAGGTVSLSVKGGTAVSWKSSKPKVASVTNGKIKALKKGSTVITATLSDGTKLTCKVKVKTSPKLSKKKVTVKKGKTVTVKIKGKAPGVNNKYTKTKKAKITSKTTATKIKVKGLKKGKTTLKVTVNGVKLKLKVKVK